MACRSTGSRRNGPLNTVSQKRCPIFNNAVQQQVWNDSARNFCGTTKCTAHFFRDEVNMNLPSLRQTSSEQWWLSGGLEGKFAGLFCAILCASIVHSAMHTHMNRPNSSLHWVLSHWAHFSVLRFILCMYAFSAWLYIACICSIVTWWGGPGETEAYP